MLKSKFEENIACEFSMISRIYYEDTDAGGVVYYANYLKFFERARTEFLRKLGFNQTEIASRYLILFIVKNCLINYYGPAKLDDEIEISTKITKIKAASIIFFQTIKLNKKIICDLEVEIVCVDAISFKPKKL